MGQIAAGLAEFDQGFEALTALLHVFFRQHGLIKAEFFHQGALFRLADLHAKGFYFFGCRDFFAFEVCFDIAQVCVV